MLAGRQQCRAEVEDDRTVRVPVGQAASHSDRARVGVGHAGGRPVGPAGSGSGPLDGQPGGGRGGPCGLRSGPGGGPGVGLDVQDPGRRAVAEQGSELRRVFPGRYR